jgi:CheY-like chemotaxis protein
VSLEQHVGSEVPRKLVCDEDRIRQVLTNLVGNAIKFTETGSVVVSISLSQRSGDLCTIRFLVRDTGIGMTAQDAANVFDPFIQADDSMSRKREGTGLGLAISRQLVSLMGGQIGVQTSLGVGSTFWFELPLLEVRSEAPNETVASEVPVGLRVLLAEDNEVNVLVAKAMLESLGCRVTHARDGVEAERALAQASFDVVLMDCQMPERDGYQATRDIRERERLEGLPRQRIVALTAHATDGAREECLQAGMDDYLAKPFTQESLGAALSRAMHGPARA